MKKLLGVGVCLLLFSLVSAQGVDHESKQSVYVLEQNGLGSSSMQHSLLYTPLARWEAAILFGQYADTILDRDADASASCNFWDVTTSSIVYADIVKSCQLGLLKWSNGSFNPYGSMTRWQLIMVVARMLAQDPSLELNAAYNYLLQQGVIKVDDRANSTRIPGRNEVYIMLARFLHNPSSASVGSPVKQILLVRTYKEDPLFGAFTMYAEWSAVLLSSTTLLTNAHVVSDENWEPTWLYEVCRVASINKDPVCFSSAVLQRVDEYNDLAVLVLPQAYTQGQTTTFRTRDVRAGEALTVVWFPYDGGTTITTTKGIVAWFDGDAIKTDAAVNYGNSGGWAYDGQWNLIGIPTALYGNIGYVVPISTVELFLDDDTVLYTTPSSVQEQLPAFKQFMQTQHARIADSDTSLDTDFFSVWTLDGFTLSASSEYRYNDIRSSSYILSSSDKKTTISMDVYYIVGQKSIDAHVAEVRSNLESEYADVAYGTKETPDGVRHILTAKDSSYSKNDISVFYLYEKNGWLFTVSINGSQLQLAAIQKAESLVGSIDIQTIPAAVSGPVSLPHVSLPLPSFAVMELSVNAGNNQPYVTYDLSFADDAYAYIWIEECGCSVDGYDGLTIHDFLADDLDWYWEETLLSTGTFVTIDGLQWYYIDSRETDERSVSATVKVVDWRDPTKAFSFVLYAYGAELTDQQVAQLIDYMKNIRISWGNPFEQ